MANGNPKVVTEIEVRPYEPKPRRPCKIAPPLMPLIDVMFTLLMFFLIAAKANVPEGLLPANLPELGGPGKADALALDPVKINLLSAGDGQGVLIEVDQGGGRQLNSMAELHAFLQMRQQQLGPDGAKAPVLIKPGARVRWEHVVNAFNQAVRARYEKVGFAPST